MNIKVHSLKRLVTPLILYLLTQHEKDTGSTVCVRAGVCVCVWIFCVMCADLCVYVSEARNTTLNEIKEDIEGMNIHLHVDLS